MQTPSADRHAGDPDGPVRPPGRALHGPQTGLVLTGGGARAAYQAGALRAVLDILDPLRSDTFQFPFHIICGTSAGAINAAALAGGAHHPHMSMRRLVRLWSSLRTAQVYHADAPGLIRTGVRWLGLLSLGWMFSGFARNKPRSLLDNAPLADLLTRSLDFEQIHRNLDDGLLTALAVTASGYSTGQHLTFYQSRSVIKPWQRALRQAVPAAISVDHLMASSAIPFVFPARALDIGGSLEWCGDGSMRQLAPISPAIRLGAERVLVIGTGHRDDVHLEAREGIPPYPSLAQIGGHALSNIFLDSVAMDIERLEHINELVVNLQPGVRAARGVTMPADIASSDVASGLAGRDAGLSLRPVRALALGPGISLDALALEYLHELPEQAHALFKVLGVSPRAGASGGGALMSYLLFEGGYTRRLIELGYADTMQRSAEVVDFFGIV